MVRGRATGQYGVGFSAAICGKPDADHGLAAGAAGGGAGAAPALGEGDVAAAQWVGGTSRTMTRTLDGSCALDGPDDRLVQLMDRPRIWAGVRPSARADFHQRCA